MNNTELQPAAHELKAAFNAASPFIQKHTALVCPSCKMVCCLNKHGNHDKNDLVFLSALGMAHLCSPPFINEDVDRKDTDPCRFLSETGCSLERWMRPYRCTWFFCDPLLESMKEDSGSAYREFINSLKILTLIRQKLIGEWERSPL
ncbi:MAG: hypothetical protein C4560_09300 [Nitrospiraceae bacterium]|nr:MAG: hypothetical protein C4560_09300 [Nitrospiraceae bacterium]